MAVSAELLQDAVRNLSDAATKFDAALPLLDRFEIEEIKKFDPDKPLHNKKVPALRRGSVRPQVCWRRPPTLV